MSGIPDGDDGSTDANDGGTDSDVGGADAPSDADEPDQLLDSTGDGDFDADVAEGDTADATTGDLDPTTDADQPEDSSTDSTDGDDLASEDLDGPDVDASDLGGDSGCTGDGECQDGVFCNGAERCVDGSCQPGSEPEELDAWSCTEARCDEDLDRIVQDVDHSSCAVANACVVGVCQPQHSDADAATGCVERLAPYATSCGAGLVCRGVECVLDGCGNEVVEWAHAEECDDGARTSGDGCSSNCTFEHPVLDLGSSAPDLRITGVDDGDGWGGALLCTDVNGDGIDDLVAWTSDARGEANANDEDTPEIRVVFGPVPLSGEADLGSLTDWVIYGVQPSESFWNYEAVAVRVEDVDGDGHADLIADAPELDDAELDDAGAVLAFLSVAAGGIDQLTRGDADVALVGADEFVDLSYAGMMDVEGDEAREILTVSRHVPNGAILRRSSVPGSRFLPDPEEAAYLLPDTSTEDIYLFGAHVVRTDDTEWLVTIEGEWSAIPGLSDPANAIVRWLPNPPWPDVPTLLTSLPGTVLAGAPASPGVTFAGSSDLDGDRQTDIILAEAGLAGDTLFLVDGAVLVDDHIDVTEPNPGQVLSIDASWLGGRASVETVVDLDGDGQREIVLGYTQGGARRLAVLPFPVHLDALPDAPPYRLHDAACTGGSCFPGTEFGHHLRALAACDLDAEVGDDEPLEVIIGVHEYEAGVVDVGGPRGEIWVYDELAF